MKKLISIIIIAASILLGAATADAGWTQIILNQINMDIQESIQKKIQNKQQYLQYKKNIGVCVANYDGTEESWCIDYMGNFEMLNRAVASCRLSSNRSKWGKTTPENLKAYNQCMDGKLQDYYQSRIAMLDTESWNTEE